MSIFDVFEIPNGKQMVNMFSWLLFAPLADTVGSRHCCDAGGAPADSVRARSATFPARVILATYKFRLPFSHTRAATKESVTVKVAGGTSEVIAAPLARLGDLATARNVGPARLALNSALKRAESLIQTPAACGFFAALLAYRFFVDAPSGRQETLTRAVATVGSSGLWVKWVIAGVAVSHFLCSHSAIISRFIEIERKYCDIAIERLRQQAFSFEEAA